MNEIPLWVVQVTSALLLIVGFLVLVAISLAVSNWAIKWILEGIIYALGIKTVLKKFAIYYKKKLRNGEVIVPRLKKRTDEDK